MNKQTIINTIAELHNRLNKPDAEYDQCKKYLEIIEYLSSERMNVADELYEMGKTVRNLRDEVLTLEELYDSFVKEVTKKILP